MGLAQRRAVINTCLTEPDSSRPRQKGRPRGFPDCCINSGAKRNPAPGQFVCSDGKSVRSHSFETLERSESKSRGNQKERGSTRESREQCLLGCSPGTLKAGSSSIKGVFVVLF